jgi:predicted 2-oxoglutarate/Fe(II)-dependent dioxygenase YbiX
MNNLKDYIVIVKDVVPHSLCDAILEEYAHTSEWFETVTRSGLRKDIRNVTSILISADQVIDNNQQKRKELDSALFQCASNAIKRYNDTFPLAFIEQDSGYELLKYEVGQFYKEHTDSFRDVPRAVSCSFALNDEYEGGEFAFFNGTKKIRVPKGYALMFPSNFMYPHQILPVTQGVRYSVITWFV